MDQDRAGLRLGLQLQDAGRQADAKDRGPERRRHLHRLGGRYLPRRRDGAHGYEREGLPAGQPVLLQQSQERPHGPRQRYGHCIKGTRGHHLVRK